MHARRFDGKNLRLAFTLATTFFLAAFSADVRANNFLWNGAGVTGGTNDQDLSTAGNWSPAGVPGPTDMATIHFSVGGATFLTQSAPLNVGSLMINFLAQGTVAFSQNNTFDDLRAAYNSDHLVIQSNVTTVNNHLTLTYAFGKLWVLGGAHLNVLGQTNNDAADLVGYANSSISFGGLVINTGNIYNDQGGSISFYGDVENQFGKIYNSYGGEIAFSGMVTNLGGSAWIYNFTNGGLRFDGVVQAFSGGLIGNELGTGSITFNNSVTNTSGIIRNNQGGIIVFNGVTKVGTGGQIGNSFSSGSITFNNLVINDLGGGIFNSENSTMTFNSVVTNAGLINNWGGDTHFWNSVYNTYSITNFSSGTFHFHDGVTITGDGTLGANDGALNFNDTVHIGKQTIVGSGSINNNGTIIVTERL